MTIFGNVNSDKLNTFIWLVQSKKQIYQPSVSNKGEAILKSKDTTLKAALCANLLIEWQDNLNNCKSDPACKLLFNADRFDEFAKSQKFLNKLKRKFSRMIIDNMEPDQRARLAKEVSVKFQLKQPNVHFVDHLFRYYGDDALCLELIGEQINRRPNSSTRPPEKSVALLGDSNSSQPHARLVLAVASTAEHFPLASNTWGYVGQESSPLSSYNSVKGEVVMQRRGALIDKYQSELNPKTPWDKVVKPSHFKQIIQQAKFIDGTLIGNCGERSLRVFHQLTKQRKFDSLARVGISPGDHLFVISKDPVQPQKHVLDAWNGAKIYPEERIENYLYDYTGIFVRNGLPDLKKFDPRTQKVKVSAYSIYPLDAFKKDSTTKHLYLIELLKQFHQIPNSSRREKMIKALEIIQFIENKMPLYEYIDQAVRELYDQMLYLTKKERKDGLKPPPLEEKDRCPINEALLNLDSTSLIYLKNGKMNGLTILHAIKASLRTNDIRFLKEVVEANVPIERNSFTTFYHTDPYQAILQLASKLSAVKDSTLDFNQVCSKAVRNHQQRQS